RAPNRRRRRQSRLCKRCAASARRRSCRDSLRFCFWRDHFLHECFKTRVAVEGIEQGIYVNPADVGAVTFLETLFEPAHRFIFIVQTEIKQRAVVADDFAALTDFIQVAQHSQRSILVTSQSFSLSAQRRKE